LRELQPLALDPDPELRERGNRGEPDGADRDEHHDHGCTPPPHSVDRA
jgi:hypothetical protein